MRTWASCEHSLKKKGWRRIRSSSSPQTTDILGDKVFNAGMRGKKGSQYDGGHRVPFFIHWPDGELTGGRDVEPITAHVDVFRR